MEVENRHAMCFDVDVFDDAKVSEPLLRQMSLLWPNALKLEYVHKI